MSGQNWRIILQKEPKNLAETDPYVILALTLTKTQTLPNLFPFAPLGDEDKYKHVHDEQEHVSVVNKGAAAGYVRGQSVIIGGGNRSYANRIGFRRSASFHAAELFEEIGLAGMDGNNTMRVALLSNSSGLGKTILKCISDTEWGCLLVVRF